MTTQQQLMAEAEKSFERNVMTTHVGKLSEDIVSLCRKCYCLGFINGGDTVLSQVELVQHS